ncbi:hypothetical protein HWV62_2924 [Athelia sp. TMB]|nr:hypothetical protein HWV62_2924 [Athelia sp. TMB]
MEARTQTDLVQKRDLLTPFPRPPAKLLLSHVVPNDVEEENRRTSIKAIEDRLAQLADHTVRVDNLVEELNTDRRRCAEERRDLIECMREYQSINTPVKRVSDDALIEIFMVYAAGTPRTRENLDAPMVLTWCWFQLRGKYLPRSLQRLVLNPGPKFFYADLIRAMKCVPGLIEFEFVEGRYSDEEPVFNRLVLYELTLGPAGPVSPLLPNLKTLSLIGRLSNDLPDAMLMMLNSRTSPPSSLEALFLQICPAKNSWIPGENRLATDPSSVLNATDARTIGNALAGTALKIFIDQSGDDDSYDDGIPSSIAFPPL